ncbi:hypothetical protein NQ314_016624 [Rhamnusium bicolor]|uniref:Uncharacterized protein n=1 Tax=Rhamnusium bicolor TaxID=1586634 RepID=A0AAV8WWC5_9CUCU|nr:hypothetical protein NQ314_016624 [Rhamnusium bicolor]
MASESVEKERKAFEAEEKLKKLAEKADQAKRNIAQLPPKLKECYKEAHYEEKKKMVLKTVKRSALPHKLSTPKHQKEQPVVVRKIKKLDKKASRPQAKVIASKASNFQRHGKKNASLRQRNVKVVAKANDRKVETNRVVGEKPSDKKDSDSKGEIVEKPKSEMVVKLSAIPKKDAPLKSDVAQVSSSNIPEKSSDSGRSLRSSINKIEPVKGEWTALNSYF